MTRIEVGPDGGKWRVSVDFGSLGYDEHHLFKFMAVLAARRTAKAHATPATPMSLRIKGRNGRYQSESTWPRSADPRRSKG